MAGKFLFITFGDQAVPYHAELQRLLANKDNYTLAAFLSEAYHALKLEISRLSPSQQAKFPNCSNLAELLIAHHSSQVPSCALDSALVCLHQIASFVSYISETQTQYPQPSSTCLIGSCIGLLAATAVSCSRNILDLVSLGPEIVALAFRIGLLVQNKTSSVTLDLDGPASYSSVVGGVNKDYASQLIDAYCQSEGLSASACIYISAVGHGNVTVSGPPAQLRNFFSKHPDLKSVKVPVNGLFHSSRLYAIADLGSILGTVRADSRKRIARLDILSNSDGQKISSGSCEALLQTAVWEILSKQLRWDLIVENATATLAQLEISEAVILPFASASAQGLAAAFRQSGIKAVKLLDTAAQSRIGTNSTGEHSSNRSKIAIIGFSGRFPEADDNEAFWQLLVSGLDVHREIPKDRFDAWAYLDPTGKKKNTSGVTKGCFLRQPGLFDSRFFGMSPREAEQADPAQRLALMTAYEAMEMAGIVPDGTPSTQRDRVGVFYGTTSDDYREVNSGQNVDTYFIPGGNRAFIPGRINYHFRFTGPSFDVDTACSSSLAAIHIACNSLWRGDCDTAIAGGTNVLTNPDNFAGLDRGHFLSRTGNCNTFDDGADGYCRAEAVATIVLKRLEDAQVDGDPIFGTILGAYTNHSAEAASITRPHSGAQRAIFQKILTSSGVEDSDVSYVEMHGTGTQHGDACEMDSVLSVFAPERSRRNEPLYLGSAKANIGHAESASGVASLIKVLLMMEKSVIPPHVGIKTRINKNFPTDLAQRNIHIAMQSTPWARPMDKPQGRRAFVNNFSAAGGNSSVLLEDAPLLRANQSTKEDPRPLHMVAVSAKTQTSLRRNICALREHIDAHPDLSVSSLSFTTTARRIHHGFRVIVSGADIHAIRNALQTAEARENFLSTAAAAAGVGFCFTGQGSQYLGMGHQLLQIPQFRSIVRDLDGVVRVEGFESILPIIDGNCPTPMEQLSPVTLQLSITCLQIALGKFWKALGISPQLVVGHSLGEYAAMNIAGVLSDADVIHLVGTRALLLEKHCSIGTHTMLAVKGAVAKVAPLIASYPGLEISCINGPEETVVGGTNREIEDFANALTNLSIKGTQLKVQFAFHSAQVEPMLAAFRHSCRSIVFKDPSIPIVSPLLGKMITSASDLGSPAAYLSRHCRETVDFYGALQSANESRTISEKTVWVEIGPHPICSNMLKGTLGPRIKAFASLRRNEDEWKVFVSTLNALYECGLSINWNEYHSGFKESLRVLRLPAYQWEMKEHWIPYVHDWCLTKGDPPTQNHPKLPASIEEEKPRLTSSVHKIVDEKYSGDEAWITAQSDLKHPDLQALLQGHKVNGRPLCTSSAYADMALTLFQRLLEKSSLTDKSDIGIEVSNMTVDKSLILNDDEPIQLIEMKASARWSTQSASLSICSISKDGKTIANHAKCTGVFTKKSQWTAEWKRREFLVKSRIEHLQQSIHDDSDSAHLIKTGMFYKLFSALVDYGDSFKGCRELIIRSADLECTARVKFNTPAGESDKWVCPPYWIDSLGQITGFTMNANDAVDSKTQVFINHGWENMRIVKTLSPETTYRTYLKMQQKDIGSYFGDVYVLDSDEIVAVYEGVTFSAIKRKLLDLVLPGPTSSKFSVTHEPRPAMVEKIQEPVATRSMTQPPPLLDSDEEDLKADKIKALVSDEVGVSIAELQDDEDLVNFGVDSLLSLTMADRIREEFGVTIDSTTFMDGLTVGELIRLITGEPVSQISSAPPTPSPTEGLVSVHTVSSSTSLSNVSDLANDVFDCSFEEPAKAPSRPSTFGLEMATPVNHKLAPVAMPPATSVLLQGDPSTAKKTLWLFPDGSGLASSYLSLPDIDAKSAAVYGLNSPYVKRAEDMKCTFAELTTVYLTEIRRRQPSGPYYLGGWSAGGICAYDAAQILAADGQDVQRLILLDSPNPIGLKKLPSRLYDEFNRLDLFGSDVGRKPPSWLLSHFLAFIDVLDTHQPQRFVGRTPLQTWVIWAEDGVNEDGSIEIRADDPENMRWLLKKRTDLGPNGWDQLVGKDNITIEVLQKANHFSMMKGVAVDRVSSFIAKAMA
ncbi:polyketide synthetase PksP [Xylariaceae sp. FL0662B]|nr:polyketide synthetase PksP [Xylariaceae sp. FL0662B]